MVALVRSWRKLWSASTGTTDPLAPFGLVTLAPSGTEGGNDMGTMRWAQTGGYGVLPNPAMPRTFLAQARKPPMRASRAFGFSKWRQQSELRVCVAKQVSIRLRL